jgi:hypothetical protein
MSGLLVIDAVGWRSMYFVVMPRVNRIVIFLTYHVIFILCYLSYGETPLVNYGPRSYFHHIAITCLLYLHYLLYSHITITFHSIFVSSKPVRLTTSSQVGNKVFGCVCAGSALQLEKQSLDEAPYKLSEAVAS